MRVITYNVQSPDLPSSPLQPVINDRCAHVLGVILAALSDAPAMPTFVCLQEVCTTWVARFSTALAQYGYAYVMHKYSSGTWPPLFCMIFYPIHTFRVVPSPVVPTGAVCDHEHITRFGLTQEDVIYNALRRNSVFGGIFTSIASPTTQFVVATYHAPCLYARHPRAQQLHIANALRYLTQFPNLPVVLAGDFNMTPEDAAYLQHVRGPDCIDAMATLTNGHHVATNSCPRFTGCLDYSFSNRLAVPTQQTLSGFLASPYLSDMQPSDHALLQTFYTLKSL